MKLIGNHLYLTWQDALDAGIPEGTLKAASVRGSRCWNIIPDPNDKRCKLIQYDALRDEYKEMVGNLLCNGNDPYKFFENSKLQELQKSSATIFDQIATDPVEQLELNKLFPADFDKAAAIAKACGVCKFYNNLPAKIDVLKKFGYNSKSALLTSLSDWCKKNLTDLFPNNLRRFQDKFAQYKSEGYRAFISKKISNANATKLGDMQKLILRSFYALPNNYDIQRVADMFNNAVAIINAERNEKWKEISYSTAYNYLMLPEVQQQTLLSRNGFGAWRNNYDASIQRERPSAPNILWVEDGWNFELYYNNENESGKKDLWQRTSVSIILDAFNDTIVGYAIGVRENSLVKYLAWKNAIETTGVLPREIKMDNFAKKALGDFYTSIAKHVRFAAVGNARDKVIEPFFARFNNQILKDYPNWSGSNITAKRDSSHPNRELLIRNKNSFPNQHEVIGQITEAINRWNTLIRKRGVHAGESVLDKWANADHSNDIKLTPQKRVEIFGINHNYKNSLTKEGLTITIDGVRKVYRLWDHEFMNRIGDQFTIRYLPGNTEMIMATDSKKNKWFVPEEGKEKMALYDQQEGDRTRLNEKLLFKKDHFALIQSKNTDDWHRLQQMALAKYVLPDNSGNAKYALNAAEQLSKTLTHATTEDEFDADLLVPVIAASKNNDEIIDEFDY